MKPEYDLSKMKSRPNPLASQLKQDCILTTNDNLSSHFKESNLKRPDK
jgi:hypothetical protein